MDFMIKLTDIAKKYGGIIETKIAEQHGVSKAMLSKLCKDNKIHRIVRGQYILVDEMQEAMLSIVYVSVSLDLFIESIYSFCNRNNA